MESEGEENSRRLLPSFSTFFFLFAFFDRHPKDYRQHLDFTGSCKGTK